MSRDWQARVDQAIRNAVERGEFECLGGKGAPATDDHDEGSGYTLTDGGTPLAHQSMFNHYHNEYYAGEKALAYKVLKNAGYLPDFLQLRKDIDAEIADLRAAVLRAVRRRERMLAQLDSARAEDLVLLHRAAWDRWYASVEEIRRRIIEINVKIEIFNLKNELPTMFMRKLDAGAEIARAEREALDYKDDE